MKAKRLLHALLFPHIAVLLVLLPVAAVGLVWTMQTLLQTAPLRIAAYVLSAYTLTIWCVRVPSLVRGWRQFRQNNRYASRWLQDVQLRMRVTLTASLVWNSAYGALQLGLGIYHHAAWFYSLAAYYASLAVMRFFLARQLLRPAAQRAYARELCAYRLCGWCLLAMNLALSGVMLYRIHDNRLVQHHEITTIAMAAYTFTSLTMAIVNVKKYRRYQSPVISASKAISLAAACVSMLSLESTMLATFGSGEMPARTQLLFLSLSGAGVSLCIVAMAVYMIVRANQTIKQNGEKQ